MKIVEPKYLRALRLIALLLRVVTIIGSIIVFAWAWKLYKSPNFMPIRHVSIIAPYQEVDQKTLVNIIEPYTSNNGLFSLDMDKLKKNLLMQPWINTVVIKRLWPDSLKIMIQEQQAIAIWNNQALVNFQGNLFTPSKNTFPMNLPLINSPIGEQQKVLEKLHQFNQALSSIKLTITELDLNTRGSWQMTLSNGIKINLGHSNIEQRFSRFIAAYPSLLAPQIQNIAGVDLRYPDGFAVAWK